MRWLPRMQNRDPLEDPAKIRRRRTWDFVFASSIPAIAVFGLLWKHMERTGGGSAIGGKIEAGVFQLVDDSGAYHPISAQGWILNLLVLSLVMLSGLMFGAAMVYFFLRYYFLPIMKAKRNSDLN